MRELFVNVLLVIVLIFVTSLGNAEKKKRNPEFLTYMRLGSDYIAERVRLSPPTEASRVTAVKSLFRQAGCKPQELTDQVIPGEESPNVICTLAGQSKETIVIGARFAYKERGDKGMVRWAGLAVLPLAAESLNAVSHRYTWVFLALGGSEQKGANYYIHELTAGQRRATRAVVNVDSIGRTPAVFAIGENGAILAPWLSAAAITINLPYAPEQLSGRSQRLKGSFSMRNESGDDDAPLLDAKPFALAGIPAISIQSLNYERVGNLTLYGGQPVTAPKLAMDTKLYEQTYNLLCVYLLYLDRNLGGSARPDLVMKDNPASPADVGENSKAPH